MAGSVKHAEGAADGGLDEVGCVLIERHIARAHERGGDVDYVVDTLHGFIVSVRGGEVGDDSEGEAGAGV